MARPSDALRAACAAVALVVAGCPPGPGEAPAAPAARAPSAPGSAADAGGDWRAGAIVQPAPAALDPGPVYAAPGAEAGWPRRAPPLAPGAGREVVARECAVCHATTYVTMQPPLEAAGWAAVVDKMITQHRAALSPGARDAAVDYLAARYGPGSIASSWSAVHAAREADAASAPASLARGAAVYARSCAACHQPDGEGIPGAFPPLAGHARALAAQDRAHLARVALFGVAGPLEVDGRTYDAAMPGWGATLDDAEVAAVLDFVVSLGGGDPGDRARAIAPFTAAEVAAVRARPLDPGAVRAARPALAPRPGPTPR